MADAPALRSQIEDRNEAFRQATLAGDATALAALYTEDAWLLPHGTGIVRGRREVENFWRRRLQRIAEIRLSTTEVSPTGPDWAREVGASHIRLKDRPEEMVGKYVVVWQKVGGVWQLEADIFNNDG